MHHLITGAGSGIGQRLAALLLERGDDVTVLARNEERAQQMTMDLPGTSTVVADLNEPRRLEGQLDGALPETLDAVHHVAGVVALAPVARTAVTTWAEHLNVNLIAAAELTRLTLPALRRTKGLVVFVNSTAGLTANPTWSAYAASKFGLRALADSLRAEERDSGVRVSTVYPGRTATPMQEAVHRDEGRDYEPDRFVRPESIANAIMHVIDQPADAVISDVSVRPV